MEFGGLRLSSKGHSHSIATAKFPEALGCTRSTLPRAIRSMPAYTTSANFGSPRGSVKPLKSLITQRWSRQRSVRSNFDLLSDTKILRFYRLWCDFCAPSVCRLSSKTEDQYCPADSASITFIISEWWIAFLCSCVICSRCGAWVVVQGRALGGDNNNDNNNEERLSAICPVPDCGEEFAFYPGETQLIELPISLFERRHFYRSELG
jgi:hypothetical protein